jgi:acyl-CoA thioester hydrolase
MYQHETQLRVRYAETDQMGYVYYGNYTQYFEVGRVEALRSLGMTYKQLEESGVMMPVLECHLKYIKPARYDDSLLLRTIVPELPGIRMRFLYELYRESVLLHKGETTLVFVDKNTMRPCQAPESLLALLRPYYAE